MLVPVEEGRDANDHFEDEDSEGPPIHCEVMAIADEHLRGQVLCSAAERVGKFTLLHKLGEAEVSYEEITVFTDQHVLRLQVSIDNAFLVQMGEGKGDLGREELGLVLREHADFDQVTEQLASLDKLHEEIDSELILEDILHVDEEGVVYLAQNIFLELDVLHLLVLQDNIFADAFHRVQLLGHLMLHEEHLSEGTLADHLTNIEVLQ